MKHSIFLAATIALTLAGPADAQLIDVLQRTGDTLPGLGDITSMSSVGILPDGTYASLSLYETAFIAFDPALMVNDQVVLTSGTVFPAQPNIDLYRYVYVSLLEGGVPSFSFNCVPVSGTGPFAGFAVGDRALGFRGDPATATGLTPGGDYRGWTEAEGAADDFIVSIAVRPPGSSVSEAALIRYELDAAGQILRETALRHAGQTVAALGRGLEGVSFHRYYWDANAEGALAYIARLDGDEDTNDALMLDDEVLAQEGLPSFTPGHTWRPMRFRGRVALNDQGSWACVLDQISDAGVVNRVVARDGVVLAETGSTLPAIFPHPLFKLCEFVYPLELTNRGDVFYTGAWSKAPGQVGYGLFMNQGLLVESGVTVVDGYTVGPPTSFHVDPSGAYVILTAGLETASGENLSGLLRLNLEQGTITCVGQPNSTGAPAALSVYGSAVAPLGVLRLRVTELPPGTFGAYAVARGDGFIPGLGGGQGDLCLGGPTQFLRDTIFQVGANGATEVQLDAQGAPFLGTVGAGDSLHFQCWYRDRNPGPTSNLSAATEVVLQ